MAFDLVASWLGALERIGVQVELRLHPGRHEVDGLPGRPALRLVVPQRASAHLDAHVHRHGTSNVLERACARFDPPLRFGNPKSVFQPSHPIVDAIGDLVADLEMPSLELGHDGTLEPRLVRRILGLFRSPQPLTPEDQAQLQRDFEDGLRSVHVTVGPAVEPAMARAVEPAVAYAAEPTVAPAVAPAMTSAVAPATAPTTDPPSTTPSPAARLALAASVLERVRLTITATSQALPLPAIDGMEPFSPGRVTLHLDADVESDPERPSLRLTVPQPGAPQLECDLLRVLVRFDGHVWPEVDAILGRGVLGADVQLRKQTLVLTPRPGIRVPITVQHDSRVELGGQWSLDPRGPALSDVRLRSALVLSPERLQLGGVVLTFAEASLELRGESELDLAPTKPRLGLTSDDLVARLRLRNPELLVGLAPLVVEGWIAAELHVRELSLSGVSGHLRGHLDLAVELPQLPEDAALEAKGLPVDIEAFADGTIRAQPITGVLEMFERWVDLNGDVTKVRDPRAPAAGAKGSAEVRDAIAARTHAVPRGGNLVELLVDGVESYPKRLELIASAKHSLCVQTLIFADDQSGTEVANLLAAKARAGVKVRVIIDALGNIDPLDPLGTMGGREVYDVMRRAGVDLRLYNGVTLESLLKLVDTAGADRTALQDPVALLGVLGRGLQPTELGAVPAVLSAPLQQLFERGERLVGRTPGRKVHGPAMIDPADLLLLVATLNHRWHEKYIIADDRALIMGGLNIADEYSYGGQPGVTVAGDRPAWRDTDVYIEGPAVLDALRSFADNWDVMGGEPIVVPDPAHATPKGEAIVQILQHRPREDGDHHIQNALLEHLASLGAGDRAYFANAYFVPMGGLAPLLSGLEAAAQRGVDVRIVTNSVTTTDAPQVNYAAVFAERQMLAAGVRVFERTGRRTMHSKFAVLGDEVVAIGSWNMDNRSESLNSEGLALVYDRTLADRAAATIEADMAPDVAVELHRDSPVMRSQKPEDELRSLALCALGELL